MWESRTPPDFFVRWPPRNGWPFRFNGIERGVEMSEESEREEKLIREPVLSAHNDYT